MFAGLKRGVRTVLNYLLLVLLLIAVPVGVLLVLLGYVPITILVLVFGRQPDTTLATHIKHSFGWPLWLLEGIFEAIIKQGADHELDRAQRQAIGYW
jgi:hypothetical protein